MQESAWRIKHLCDWHGNCASG